MAGSDSLNPINPLPSLTEVLSFAPGDLGLTVDWVLQGQGADPDALRVRRPRLVDMARQALAEGLTLIQPRAALLRLPVEVLSHQRLTFQGGGWLAGQAVGQHLAGAREATVMVYSAGSRLEARIQSLMASDLPYALALDGVGTAAIDALGGLIYHQLEEQAAANGWQVSILLSPGMMGWSVEEGQPQIFRLIDAARIGVRINPAWVMIPRKSTSGVVGAGPGLVPAQGLPCEFCALQGTCRYQGRHTHDS